MANTRIRLRLFGTACTIVAPIVAMRTTGYVDLVVVGLEIPLLVEVEMTTARVGNDLQKRGDFGADAILWIVAPHRQVAKAIRKTAFSLLRPEEKKLLFVFTFGAAIQRILDKRI